MATNGDVGSGFMVDTDTGRCLFENAVQPGNYFQGRTMDADTGAVLGEFTGPLPSKNYSTSFDDLTGWEAMNGGVPGTIVPVGSNASVALGELVTGVASAILVSPVTVERATQVIVMRVLNANLILPRTVSIVGRLTPTSGVRVNIGRNGSYLDVVLYEWLAGAWRITKSAQPIAPLTDFNVALSLAGTTANVYIDGSLRLTADIQTTERGRGGVQWQSQPTGLPILTSFIQNDPEGDDTNASLGAITFVGGAIACFNNEGAEVADMVVASGLPFTPDGRLIVDGISPIVNVVNGLPFTEFGALAVNQGFAPATVATLSTDPLFTTAWGAVWKQRYGALNVEILYEEADLWVKGAGWGPQQSIPWLDNGQAVTVMVRLAEALAAPLQMQMRAEPRSGTTVIGNVDIPAGSLFGSAKFTMSSLTAPPDATSLVFLVNAGPTMGALNVNDFSGSGSNTLTGWEASDSVNPSATRTPVTTANLQTLGGLLATGTVQSNAAFYGPSTFVATDVEVEAYIVASGGNVGLTLRMTDTQMCGVLVTNPGNALTLYDWAPTATAKGNFGTIPAFPFTMKLKAVGDQVSCYIDGVLRGTLTTTTLVAGRVGVRLSTASTNLGVLDNFKAMAGGVHFESFSALILAADGGVKQTLDPYFANPGGTVWTGSGGNVANNRLTLNANTQYRVSPFAGVVAGDQVEVRIFIRNHGAGNVAIYDGVNTYDAVPASAGWHGLAITLAPGFPGSLGLIKQGSAGLIDTEFFFAAKV